MNTGTEGAAQPVVNLDPIDEVEAVASSASLDRHMLLGVDPQQNWEALMALARVVTFDGVDKERIDEMKREMEGGERPAEVPAKEVLVLHDPEAQKSLAIVFFESEDDYRRGDEALNAMPAGDTPGQRTSVTKYEVAIRMTE
jgi:hypothetical protein